MSQRLAQLEKLHAADPGDPFLTYGIALEHSKAGRFDDAVNWLDKTITLDEHYHYAYFQKAKALSEVGHEDDARRTLEAGIALARQANDEQASRELAELLDSLA